MQFEKTYHLTAKDFREYDNAEINYFEYNDRGVILHYTKDGKDLSLGAATLENALKQWNGGLI